MSYTRDQALGIYGVIVSSPKVQAMLEAQLGHKRVAEVPWFSASDYEILDQAEKSVLALIKPLQVLASEVARRKGDISKQLDMESDLGPSDEDEEESEDDGAQTMKAGGDEAETGSDWETPHTIDEFRRDRDKPQTMEADTSSTKVEEDWSSDPAEWVTNQQDRPIKSAVTPKKRGRPKGSKNKSKTGVEPQKLSDIEGPHISVPEAL